MPIETDQKRRKRAEGDHPFAKINAEPDDDRPLVRLLVGVVVAHIVHRDHQRGEQADLRTRDKGRPAEMERLDIECSRRSNQAKEDKDKQLPKSPVREGVGAARVQIGEQQREGKEKRDGYTPFYN